MEEGIINIVGANGCWLDTKNILIGDHKIDHNGRPAGRPYNIINDHAFPKKYEI
jgi:hypothetical protein